ncbi:MAG: hypothetical protein M3220_03025 [Chloroflexota bacterium]|nr:hypothetical protein [Chloroflexota bacterium]
MRYRLAWVTESLLASATQGLAGLKDLAGLRVEEEQELVEYGGFLTLLVAVFAWITLALAGTTFFDVYHVLVDALTRFFG